MSYFPYEKIRKEQDKLITQVVKNLMKKGNLIVHAPTGLGKTASAIPYALERAMKENKTVFFLTNRHTQHEIAIETINAIKRKFKLNFLYSDLVGKKFMCGQESVHLLPSADFFEFCKKMREDVACKPYRNLKNKEELSLKAERLIEKLKSHEMRYDSAIIKDLCMDEELCPYYFLLEVAKKSRIIIGDFNHLFDPFVCNTILGYMGKKLEDLIVIVDEAHNLPERIRNLLSTKLTFNMIKNTRKEAKKNNFNELAIELNNLFDGMTELLTDELLMQREVPIKKEIIRSFVIDYDKFKIALNDLADVVHESKLHSYASGMLLFLEIWEKEGNYIFRCAAKEEREVEIRQHCLDPSVYSKKIFNESYSSILMSGTLLPPDMFEEVLGLNAEKKVLASPFPEENRIIMIDDCVSSAYSKRNRYTYQLIAQRCETIMGSVPGNKIIFFPSYNFLKKTYENIKNTEDVLIEDGKMKKEEKEFLLKTFKDGQKKGITLFAVIAGGFSEGIDLPNELLNAVVIVGLPLSVPDLKTKALMQYYQERFRKGREYGYIFPAMNKVLQAAGRCIRTEEDKGAIILMDDRYWWKQYKQCLPSDWSINAFNAKKLKDFFNKN